MIHLIGVDHLIQYKNEMIPEKIFNEFRNFLTNQVDTIKATLIAEEFHEEYLKA